MCEGKVLIVRNGEVKEQFEEVVSLLVDYNTRKVTFKTEEGGVYEYTGFTRIFCDFVKHLTRIELS
mgnify:CR=1 FL=1